MNNNYQFNNDSIGTDPSILPIIDTLDSDTNASANVKAASPASKKNNNKGKEMIKKIIFTIVVLLLMGGVAFGVYYYLSLGTNKGNSNNTTKKVLDDLEFYVGDNLPTSILEYGDFTNIDISKCVLDTSAVNTSKPGSYTYNVTCDESKYNAKIIIKVNENFPLETRALTAYKGDSLTATDFITSQNNYTYEFVNETAVLNYLKSAGGPYAIEIRVKDEFGMEKTVNASLMVLSSKPEMLLTCVHIKSTDNYLYSVTDKMMFDADRNYTNIAIRSHVYTYMDATEYNTVKKQINNGNLTIEGNTGLAVFNDSSLEITITSSVSISQLSDEYGSDWPDDYFAINSYYRNTKGYSCSI